MRRSLQLLQRSHSYCQRCNSCSMRLFFSRQFKLILKPSKKVIERRNLLLCFLLHPCFFTNDTATHCSENAARSPRISSKVCSNFTVDFILPKCNILTRSQSFILRFCFFSLRFRHSFCCSRKSCLAKT